MRRVLVPVLVGAPLLLASVPASAASAADSGWWSSSPVAPAAPDAPSGGLVVQGGPDTSHPLAFAGVRFTLDVGEHPSAVTLHVAPSSATTPGSTLEICPLTSTFTATQAPTYDCTIKATATPSSDGTSYRVDVSHLAATDILAFAILPAAPTDRVVLAKPDAVDVESGAGSASGPSATAGVPAEATTSSPVTSGSGNLYDVAPAPLPDAPVPAADTPRAAPEAALPAAAPVVASTAAGSHHSHVPGIAFAGLAVVAGALWLSAGTHEGEPA